MKTAIAVLVLLALGSSAIGQQVTTFPGTAKRGQQVVISWSGFPSSSPGATQLYTAPRNIVTVLTPAAQGRVFWTVPANWPTGTTTISLVWYSGNIRRFAVTTITVN